MSSRCLGESTEQARNSLKEIEENGEFAAAIEGERCKENDELLKRSAIGITDSLQSSESIMEHILAEGVNCITIKAMGGMQHLIIFETLEDKQNVIECKWLEQWFIEIRNVNKHSATLWRETWISIYGTPLIAWGYRNFHKIGSVFGRVKSISYERYDCAHILIITDCLFDINCKIQLQIDEENYSVYISEKQQVISQRSSTCRGETESETEELSGKKEKTAPGKSSIFEKSCSDDEETKSQYENDVGADVENSKRHNHENTDQPPTHTHTEDELKNLGKQKMVPLDIDTHHRDHNHNPTEEKGKAAGKRTDLAIGLPEKSQSQPPISDQSNHKISPTQKTHPTKSPMHISPQISTSSLPPKKHMSPIQLNNKFGPLLKNNKTNPSSTSTMASSSCSGPIFPPGFEHVIPIQTRIEKERKRRKKMEKKRRLKKEELNIQKSESLSPARERTGTIHIDEVIKMAEIIGLTFNGPVSELKKRIGTILNEQMQNWVANS